jgi:hypothetical protein
MKFRKKPVTIDAIRWTGDNYDDLVKFVMNSTLLGRGYSSRVFVKTLEGEMTVDKGDWIIKGVAGEFYPIKHEIFANTYDPTDPEAYQAMYGPPPKPAPSPFDVTENERARNSVESRNVTRSGRH